jgi:hypothetical protein
MDHGFGAHLRFHVSSLVRLDVPTLHRRHLPTPPVSNMRQLSRLNPTSIVEAV